MGLIVLLGQPWEEPEQMVCFYKRVIGVLLPAQLLLPLCAPHVHEEMSILWLDCSLEMGLEIAEAGCYLGFPTLFCLYGPLWVCR